MANQLEASRVQGQIYVTFTLYVSVAVSAASLHHSRLSKKYLSIYIKLSVLKALTRLQSITRRFIKYHFSHH